MQQRILVVDDDPLVRVALKAVLQSYGYAVVQTDSAEKGKLAIAQTGFDLVVTDLEMETATAGYEIARFASHQAPAPAVILFTAGYADGQRQPRGVSALLRKPASISTLLGTIEVLLQGRTNPREDGMNTQKTANSRRPQPDKLEEQIRRRAYRFYEQRGGEEGKEVQDWLQAEAEITQRSKRGTAA